MSTAIEDATPKQREFSFHVANGKTLVDSYRLAYDAENMSVAAVYREASKLMDHPKVAALVKQILDDRYDKSLINSVQHVRRYVFDRLMEESSDPANKGAERLKALEMLGKVDVIGMFRERREVEVVDKRRPEEIEREIREKLERFLQKPALSVDYTKDG